MKDTKGELERIKKEINNFRKSESEDISAMVIRLLNLKNCFERAGGDMDEDMKCNILLKALVLRKWDQTTLDIKKRYKKKEIKYEELKSAMRPSIVRKIIRPIKAVEKKRILKKIRMRNKKKH